MGCILTWGLQNGTVWVKFRWAWDYSVAKIWIMPIATVRTYIILYNEATVCLQYILLNVLYVFISGSIYKCQDLHVLVWESAAGSGLLEKIIIFMIE